MNDAQPTPLSSTDHPAPPAILGDTLSLGSPLPPVKGFYTTEFWVSVLSLLGVFILILVGKLDAQTGLIVLGSIVPGYAISRGLTKHGAGGVVAIGLLLCVALSGCAGQTNSPFTSASAPEAGKIPVKVVVGTSASGNTADPSRGTDYAVNGQVVFGKAEPWYRRVLHLFTYGPLTPADQARWDADLHAQAAATVPLTGVVHYPGEAP